LANAESGTSARMITSSGKPVFGKYIEKDGKKVVKIQVGSRFGGGGEYVDIKTGEVVPDFTEDEE